MSRENNPESGVAFGGFKNVSKNKGKSLTSSESGLRSEITAVKQELQGTHQELQRLAAATELLLARQTASFELHGEQTSVGPTAQPSVPTMPSTITRHFHRVMPASFTPSSRQFPQSLLISMKSLTISCAFHKWYTEELFKCTVRTEKERKVRRKIAYSVAMMKRFLPAGTIIQPKPDSLEQFQTWSAQIRAYGELAQEQALTVCYQAYNSDMSTGTRKRKRQLQVMVEGMIRRLGNIAKNNPALIVNSGAGAQDLANPTEADADLDLSEP